MGTCAVGGAGGALIWGSPAGGIILAVATAVAAMSACNGWRGGVEGLESASVEGWRW